MELVSEEEMEILIKDSGINIIDAIKGIPIEEKSWIPEDCGVYIITTTDGDLYVGASSNILTRISHHHIKNIETIDVYLTSDYQKLEKWFIHQIKPCLNVILYSEKKSVAINQTAYGKIIEKQGQIYFKYKQRIDLMKIASAAIIRGMDSVEEELGLKKDE